ncbi:MAG: DUF3592 domain-containing protein [Gammaproteobacteria bacterium]|nr:DUF3592 domain-containing protein [Gammaproteobacteria bacterium]
MRFPWQINWKILGLCLLLLGLLPLSNGLGKYRAVQTYVSTSISTDAVVVGYTDKTGVSNPSKTAILYPVVRFSNTLGSEAEATTNVGRYPAAYEIGERVAVRFSIDHPQDVRIDSTTGLWFESLFYLVPGLLMVLTGIWLLIRSRRH